MHPYVVADVFTDRPLEGNPVAVFTAGQDVPGDLMQSIARELNLSETVFVLPAGEGGDARVRIFTPAVELPFAGHPILGTAYVLGQANDRREIRLETGAGIIPVTLTRKDGRITEGRMAQPIPTWEVFDQPAELLAALGVRNSLLPIEVYTNGPRHLYVMLDDTGTLAALRPDLATLSQLPGIGVNCFAGSGTHWTTRMFGPSLGVPEDPATGSAAGPLAVHLARHQKIDYAQDIEITQGLQLHRPSKLQARAEGQGDKITKVEVAGSAVLVTKAELTL